MPKAVVTATSPLAVKLEGAGTAVLAIKLASYTATVADRVLVTVEGSTVYVLGKLP